ncbi:MAG: HD domain-containing protein [Candidatus Riflebacteria bacterium]|nr:HD domain-containing protein [Candidatus Riflebacteria bacterium]
MNAPVSRPSSQASPAGGAPPAALPIEQAIGLQRWFDAYVDRFRQPSGGLEPMLELKYFHCGRVAAVAEGIAADLGWPADEVRLARTVGLLHDVGRFSQFRQFGTYHDPVSVDHGQRGCEVLAAERALDGCPAGLARLIRGTVRLHNARALPPSLRPAAGRFVRLVRDADKIDALRIFDEAIETGTLRDNPEICWNMPRHGPLSPRLLEDVGQGRIGSYAEVRSVDDFQLVLLSWAFDLQFGPSRRRARVAGYFDRMVGRLPDGPLVRRIASHVFQALEGDPG